MNHRLLAMVSALLVAAAARAQYVCDGVCFCDGIWAYGVRNPWRSAFDAATCPRRR